MELKHKGYAIKLAKANVRYGRGKGHLSFIIETFKLFVFYGGFVLIIENWLHISIPQWFGIPLVIGYFISCYLVGWLDQVVGFWKTEAAYSAEELNPFFKEMSEKLDRIETQVN